MSFKQITLLSGSLFLIMGASSAMAQSAQSMSKEQVYDLYKASVPTANIDNVEDILSEKRKNLISDVMECSRQLKGFSGIEIRHAPEYIVALKFNKRAQKKLKKCTTDPIFLGVLAPLNKSELKNIESQIQEELSKSYIKFSTRISIRRNRVILKVEKDKFHEAKQIVKAMRFPSRAVRFVAVDNLKDVPTSLIQGNQRIRVTPESLAYLDGPGGGICTTGFNVIHTSTNQKGVTTAGHCEDLNAKVVGLKHTFMGESAPDTTHVNQLLSISGNHRRSGVDLQWHHRDNEQYDAEISLTNIQPSSFIPVYRASNSNSVPSGSIVFAIGRSGGNTEPNALKMGFADGTETRTAHGMSHTWARAKQAPEDATANNSFTQAGDSGGPVFRFYMKNGFFGVDALGGIRGHLGTEHGALLYTPTEKFAQLGINILTQPGPPDHCPIFDPYDPACWGL
ncbi:MAG: hypothetical protein COA43_08530 [Robiginitomaculum sp.]|nr:MAG: hypothetical protein COA43_08530 [Robiginitomaculum sp.]